MIFYNVAQPKSIPMCFVVIKNLSRYFYHYSDQVNCYSQISSIYSVVYRSRKGVSLFDPKVRVHPSILKHALSMHTTHPNAFPRRAEHQLVSFVQDAFYAASTQLCCTDSRAHCALAFIIDDRCLHSIQITCRAQKLQCNTSLIHFLYN